MIELGVTATRTTAHGTASWRISRPGMDDYFLGHAVVTGPSNCQLAYQSELCGLYGIVLSVWSLVQTYEFQVDLTIGCDGLSALNQFQFVDDFTNPNIPQFDLISATRWLLKEINGKYNWKHIKGHQDDDARAVLDEWAYWNIQMDRDAKQIWDNRRTSVKWIVYSGCLEKRE